MMKNFDPRVFILAIIIILSVTIGFRIYFPKISDKTAALSINDKMITPEELERLYASRAYHNKSRREFIDSLITREILIQEALRQGIDREEPFRRSVQDFYEQSLIKILLDRKYKSLEPADPAELVERYLFLSGKRVNMTRIRYRKDKSGERKEIVSRKKIESPFDELSMDVRFAILRLQTGETSVLPEEEPDSRVITVIRLDSTEEIWEKKKEKPDRERIREMMADYMRGVSLSQWIDTLKEKAEISIFDTAYGKPEDGK